MGERLKGKVALISGAARGQAIERVAQPEEMASAALFLASDESAFITGADLAADAGLSAGRSIPGIPGR